MGRIWKQTKWKCWTRSIKARNTLAFFIFIIYINLLLEYNNIVMATLSNFSIRHPYPHEEGQTIFVREQSWLTAYSNIFSQAEIKKHFNEKKNNPIYRRNNLNKISDLSYYVGCIEDKVVAVLDLNFESTEPNTGEIVCFYCLPEYQRHGIGTKLFNFAKNSFILAGLKKFKVEVLKDNKSGTNFYIKQGGNLVSKKDKLLAGKQLTFLTFEFDI